MALNKEFLVGVNETMTDEQVEKILKELETETTGLKVKNNEILGKNKEYKENLDKLTAEFGTKEADYQKRIEELDKQIKASGSDELKAYYEAEKKQIQDLSATKIAESDKKITAGQAAYDQLYGEYLKVLKNTELDQAMDKVNDLDPAMRSILRDVFWARHKFDFKEIEPGKEKSLMSDDFKSIADSLTAFIGTDEGKRFRVNGNTGGGATGSANVKPQIGNPFIKGKENFTEQGRLLKTNPALYNTLKAQAEALGRGA
jgi:hypothetical protein